MRGPLAPGELWKHLKSKRIYVVLGACRLEATNRPGVLYTPVGGEGSIWVRDEQEFLDGRFEPFELPTAGVEGGKRE